MAERRMFAKSIVLSDAFLDMPMSARCLYFTLGMLADDDGFIGNPKSIMRQCGASNDDMNILLTKRYLLGFESGVIVIKHWRINNYLRTDRYKETTYVEEKSQLYIDEKGSYTDHDKSLGIPMVYPDKNSIDKNSIDKNIYKGLSGELISTLHEFEKMRNKIKAPLTDKAKKMLLNKLDSMAKNDETKIKILEQSILNCWKGIYELKDQPKESIETINYDASANPTIDNSKLEEILKKRGTK